MSEWFRFSAFDLSAAGYGLAAAVLVALGGWLLSLAKRDVSIVDSLWSLMFLASLGTYLFLSGFGGWRDWLVLTLAAIWAIRLSAHITWRGWGEPEDRRYQAIRANNQPNFALKSLYIVFGLQAILAWLISFPMLAAVSNPVPPNWLDAIGLILWLTGMTFETVGDAQLARFQRIRANRGKVLNTGLWRYTRHPNYFGEFLLQWGFFVLAVPAGGAWTIFAPLLITWLLLRVSGVTMLEKDIESRRPEYREYVASTNAFFPGRPKPGPEFALFVGLVLSLTLPLAPLAVQADAPERVWNFKVLVDEKPIGHHRFYVDQEGDTRKVRSVADFEYRLLFLTLYDYEHENREVWDGACLQRIESTTNANGKEYAVEGQRSDGAFVIERGEEASPLPECIQTFAYWDPAFLEEDRLLNSQNGKYIDVDITEPVADRIEVRGDTVEARRYRIAADEIVIDLWYTLDRQWVGLETERSGRNLRYVLQ